MKKLIFIAGIASVLMSCNTHSNVQTTSTGSTKDTLQMKTAIYQCPMDTEVTSSKPGKCPKCGMDLELKQ